MSARPNEPHIALIVEGPGDGGAIPVMLRKYLYERAMFIDVLATPLATNGLGNVTSAGGIEKFVSVAASRPGCRAILVVLDSDRECVVERATALLSRVGHVAQPVTIALAERDFEDWIYASAETLGFEDFAPWRPDINGGAEIKNALLPTAYTKPQHQPALASKIDFGVARGRSKSLDRLLSRVDSLLPLL
jgi:hypothetical protein